MAYYENLITKGQDASDTGLLEHLANIITGTEVENESMGIPNGSITYFSGTLAGFPVGLGRLRVTYTVGGSTYEAYEDGAGYLYGEHIDNTASVLNHATGVYILQFTTSPDNTTALTGTYLHGEPGADWRLWYHGVSWGGDALDRRIQGDSAYPSGCIENAAAGEEWLLGVGDGATSIFQKVYDDDGTVFAKHTMSVTYTVGGVEHTDYSNEIGCSRTGNPTAITNRHVGSLARFEAVGRFYRSAYIASSSIAWESPRQVDIIFSVEPDAGTDVVIKYWTYVDRDYTSMSYIFHSTGPSGNEDIWINLFSSLNHSGFTGTSLIYATAWSYYDISPNQNLSSYYSTDYYRSPGGGRTRIWDSNCSLNVYSNQRRVVLVIETQLGYYQNLYAGQFLRPCEPKEYSTPLFVGGCQAGNSMNHGDVTSNGHTSFFHLNNVWPVPTRYLCFPNNEWFQCGRSTEVSTDTGDGVGLYYNLSYPVEKMPNGGIVCHPIYMWSPSRDTARQFLGVFDNIFTITSATVSSMDLVDDGEDTYRIFPDVNRVSWYQWWCVKREGVNVGA